MISNADLVKILAIGHDTSMRGEGISLHEAISRSNYVNLRNKFDYKNLIQIIEINRDLITEWELYSMDKRTEGGFYLKDDEIGSVDVGCIERISNKPELVAKYVIRELDFWAKFQH
jgi:hypothetical protein